MLSANLRNDIVFCCTNFLSVRSGYKLLGRLLAFLLIFFSLTISAQEITLNNYTGKWTDDAAWIDGTAESVSGIVNDVDIFGHIIRYGDLEFSSSTLQVHDTLVIFGDLTFNSDSISIQPGGILIVRGDISFGANVVTLNEGVFIARGIWDMQGLDSEGEFDNDGLLYILAATPDLKTGAGYGDFTCVNPVDSCEQYNEADLLSSLFGDFYLSGSFVIDSTSVKSICEGDSVGLYAIDSATSYQWYRDDVEIPGAMNDTFYADLPGIYHVTFKIGVDSFALEPVNVNVFPLPVVTVQDLASDYCQGLNGDTIRGVPFGGTFNPSPQLFMLGGDSALFNPSVAGSYSFTYVYTDANGCVDSSIVSTVVFPPPVLSIDGLNGSYCEGGQADTIAGNPSDGAFFPGPGLTVLGQDSAIFNPEVAGTYDIFYHYVDLNGCTDTIQASVTVHALPLADFLVMDTDQCVDDPPDTLSGNYAPIGEFTGGSVVDQGDGTGIFFPVAAGTYSISYVLEDVNGCRDTAEKQITVHPLPTVEIGNYKMVWDVSDPSFPIAGSPVGGTFSGKGISGFSYDPVAAGVGFDTVVYTYLNASSCANSDTIIFEIRDYDFMAGARIIDDIDQWCSTEAAYTTSGATPDQSQPGCLSYGPNVNRWFLFQATTEEVHIQVKIGGSEGSAARPLLALFDTLGNELACQTYYSTYTDISRSFIGLVPGEWYYISVDNRYAGNSGTFTLCVDDEVDYDFKEGAIVVPHTDNWSSAEGEYTTYNATPDRIKPDCWNDGPTSNRWFTFTALTPYITIDLLVGGSEGSMTRPSVALLNEYDEVVACGRYTSTISDIRIGSDSLTIGHQYFIMVDHQSGTGNRGTFTLAVDDEVDYDFKAGAIEIPHTGDYRSADAEFSTVAATGDVVQGSCWPHGTTYSRWFMFEATTDEVLVEVLTGGFDGDLRRAYVMLLDSLGTELACMRYSSDWSDLKLAYKGLTPGEWYYIVVDNHENSGYCGTFSLALDNSVGYDYKSGAVEITDIDNWCSGDAAFTTINASPDEAAGSCWPTGPSFNRWFKFEATTNEVLVRLKTGGDEGDLRRALVALWDESGNELSCGRYSSNNSDVSVASTSLVPGETYYISVDNYYTTNTGYRGTFSLCVRDEVDYDYPEGAVVLNDLSNWCSVQAAYTTVDASADGVAGSCWPNGPSFNRWFTFQATTNEVLFRVNTGGDDGSLRRALVTLFDSSFNEVACNRYSSDYSDVAVGSSELVPGEWYFVSVDNYYTTNSAYRGTFSVCITDAVDYDFREGAYVLTDISNWCSAEQQFTTTGATADGTKPDCWPTDPAFDRWFVFQATGPEAMFTIKTGGDEGSLRRAYAALYDTLGNEVACQRYTSDYSDISIGFTALVPGEWYYLSVDNYYTSSTAYRGSFTLCANDVVDYDYKEGAIEISDIDNWCSVNQAYTTIGATPDRNAGSCWLNGPAFNRWFKFRATTSMIFAEVKTGGDEGSLRRPYLALWDESDNELACSRYTSNDGDLVLGYTSLTPGEWYYISVDNYENTGYRGSFSLCTDDTVDYDYPQSAHIISDVRNYCSAEAAFSTTGASPDGPIPACWSDGPNFNRWFAFQATASGEITVTMKTGGDEGTLRYPMLALYDTLFNEIVCQNRVGVYDDIELTASGLIPGEWYFISADNRDNTAYCGTFTLCTDDILSYDFREGAIEITDTDNWCSENAEYTTVGATPDESVGSCWQNGPNYNRWFKFQANSTDISIQVRIAGLEGDINRALVSLWDSTLNEIECQQWIDDDTDTEISSQGLTIGEWYFISVDNATGGRRGSFTLCVTDQLQNDFKAEAITLTDLNDWCSEKSYYTNTIATADETAGSCWSGAENDNVWFRFNATSTKATIRIHAGADSGMMVNPQAAVFDAAGTEITCAGPLSGQGELVVLPTGMTIGDWYYIAVDDDAIPGTFTVCIDDTIEYDYPQGAFEIPNPATWCSPEATLSNSNATIDSENGTCWQGSSYRNVWFKFTAPTNTFKVEIKTGQVYGTLDRQQFAIFDENMTEIKCRGAEIRDGILQLETSALIAGEEYYIAVDNGESDGGNVGSFTICTDTTLSYDYKDGAIELPHNYCSADAEYTLVNSTGDEAAATCWGGTELTNVWFKFEATTPYVTVSLKSGSVYGNLRRGQMAIWNENGDEIACASSEVVDGTLPMRIDTLSVGHTYYIAIDVDESNSSDRIGSFSLCLEDALDYDYIEGANLIPHDFGCSGDAAYSNALATADENYPDCWSTDNGLDNVWFTFIATTPYAHARVRTGGIFGSMDYPQVALWNKAGEEVACVGRSIREGTLDLMIDTLTVGNQYWISVDDDSRDGTFSFCLDNELNYDYRIGATTISHDYGCSNDAAFSNYQATPDESQGSCWEGTENKNVWFRFQAQTTFATIKVKTGSVFGSMDRQQIALWNEAGVEVACIGPLLGEGTLELVVDSLTTGHWYYISVDDNSRSGTFSLCVEDQLNFDYRSGAEVIPHDLGCSGEAAYSNFLATPDETQGSCWSGTENKNVWFTFTANSPYLTFRIKTGSVYGSMNYAQAALWNASGSEIACVGPLIYEGTSILSCDTLTPGQQYWISVDDNNRSGSFTICSDDQPTYNFKAGAIELSHDYGCTGDAEYTTLSATDDEEMGSCWSGTENKNVWFKFLATTPNVTVKLRNDNVYGSLDYPQMAIWNETGDEVACLGRTTRHGEFTLGIDTLAVGEYYYISIDDDEDAGSFTLCIDDEVSYDFFGGAIEVAHDQGCSSDAEYSNYFATADRMQGSCWSGTENKNVWFRFQAVSTGVTVRFKNGSIYGSLDYLQAALWDDSGTELTCLGRTERESSRAYLSYEGLTPGNYYYVSVDDDEDAGSFTICFDDKSNYDYKGGAYEIPNPVRWCSSDAQFSNEYATFDENRASCWEASADKNVWFKFTAISRNLDLSVKNSSVYGDMRELQVAVWNENGDELACNSTTNDWLDIGVQVDTLTPGNTYYISVDDGNRDGSFSLCVNNDPLDAVISGTQVSCNGAADGTVSVTASGGTGTVYHYQWEQDGVPLVETTPSLSGLQPAVYQVTITDAGNPSDQVTLTYTVTEDPPLTLTLSSTNEICPGDANGSVSATVGGGSGMGFTYTWYRNDNSIAVVAPSINGLSSAEYKVIVADVGAPSCNISDSLDVITLNTASTDPTGINITNNNICQGTPKELTVEGGSLGTGATWKWYLDAGYSTPAGPDGITLSVDPSDTTEYWVRAEGVCNNTSSVSQTVNVVDLVDPIITDCASDKVLNAVGGCQVLVPDLTTEVIASDNCDASPMITQSPLAGSTIGLGTTVVTITVTDDEGNAVTCEADITVTDNEAPVFSSCPSDITIGANDEYCGNTATWVAPTASDNCGVTVTSSHAPGDFFDVGTTLVTYTAEDPSGNSATCSFNVTVTPAASPVITGDTDVCTPVTEPYSTPVLAGKTYLWSTAGGTISGSNTDADVDVVWTGTAPGTLVLEVTSGSGCSVSNSININKQATPVIGDIQSGSALTRR